VLFHECLDEALLRVRRDREKFAVLYLDLDQFKNVNDTLGHPAGDRLLVAVAERLRACLRAYDMVARFGGDEFAVLQMGLAGTNEASALAERIVTRLSEPYDIDGQQSVIGASVGIALAPADGETAEKLLANADMALFFWLRGTASLAPSLARDGGSDEVHSGRRGDRLDRPDW
jgi:diguanylate cyclase (GGDEF)-like protein